MEDESPKQEVMHPIEKDMLDAEKAKRIEKYAELEKVLNCPLIVYFTSTRPNIPGDMNSLAERPFIDVINKVSTDKRDIAILLHSAGGSGGTAWKLMSMLRERFDNITVIVPYMAYSAATMFALGANRIIMHPYANLGPIDPQITITKNGSRTNFAYEDLCGYFRFLKKEANINGEEQTTRLMEKMFVTLDPQSVGLAHRASEMAGSIGERMLGLHMEDNDKAKQISLNLNRSFFHHGDAVSRTLAKKMELPVDIPDSTTEQLIWDTYLLLEEYMKLRDEFNPYIELAKDPETLKNMSEKIIFPPIDHLDPGLKEIASKKFGEMLEKKMTKKQWVEYEFICELIESKEHSEVHIEQGRIVNGEKLNMFKTFSGWKNI